MVASTPSRASLGSRWSNATTICSSRSPPHPVDHTTCHPPARRHVSENAFFDFAFFGGGGWGGRSPPHTPLLGRLGGAESPSKPPQRKLCWNVLYVQAPDGI